MSGTGSQNLFSNLVMLIILKDDLVYQFLNYCYTEEKLASLNFPPLEQIAGRDFLLASSHRQVIFKELI